LCRGKEKTAFHRSERGEVWTPKKRGESMSAFSDKREGNGGRKKKITAYRCPWEGKDGKFLSRGGKMADVDKTLAGSTEREFSFHRNGAGSFEGQPAEGTGGKEMGFKAKWIRRHLTSLKRISQERYTVVAK